jgi:hypothetical protein
MAAPAGTRGDGEASHLPKQDGQATPGPPPELPRQLRGTTPQMRGRYPHFDVLATAEHWDAHTREVVLARVGKVPPLRFFDEREATTLRAFCDVVMAQDSEPRIPVLEMVDEKLHADRLDGFRYEDMPTDQETWRHVAANLDESARREGADGGFAAAGSELQHELEWDIPVSRAWSVVMRMVLSAFYSHPWAWNEIGFGGPAYPRGFARLGSGQRDHWESPPEFSVDPVADVHERGLE